MNLLDHIDTVVFDFLATLGRLLHPDAGSLAPAAIDQAINNSGAASQIKSILTLISFGLCVIFGFIFLTTALKKRALENAAQDAEAGDESGAAAPAVSARPGALRGRWSEVLGHLDSARENDWKTAVILADKLVDLALAQAGFAGDTFGDRLTNIQPGTLLSLDGLWWAHKVRNRLAHELDYFLRYTEARSALSYYEATLNELKLI